MKKIYYEKVGRKYVPVQEYDNELMDSFPKGNHLVMCYPGGQSRRFNIEPALAPMIAAARYAEDAMSKAVQRASEMRPHNKPITEEQKAAWDHLAKLFDSERYYVELPSAREVTEAGLKAMEDEAAKLLEHPMVKQAYDEFMATCKLVIEQDK
jgi:hypothetical protein